MSFAVTAISAVAVSSAVQIYGSHKARKERKKAAKIDQRRRNLDSQKAQIANIEEFRVVTGGAQNIAGQSDGGVSGSGISGLVSSLGSQLGANVNYENQLLTFAKAQEKHLNKANLIDTQTATATTALNTFASGLDAYRRLS